MKNTHIEWTDHTFNPWEGCTKVSPGCAHCYAETRNQRFSAGVNWGKGAPRRRTSVQNWNQPLRWNRLAPLFLQCTQGCRFQSTEIGLEGFCPSCGDPQADAVRPRVFCASLADWLDDEVPIEWLADLLHLIHETPNLDWQLLTKRPQNWKERIAAAMDVWSCRGNMGKGFGPFTWLCSWYDGKPPLNVWIGTTVEDQTRAEERIPLLLKIPANVRFLSCEPLLSSLDLSLVDTTVPAEPGPIQGINWVICGGESGPGARPMHPEWARSLRDQCDAAGIPFFFKQWGVWSKYIDRDKEDPDWKAGYAAMGNSKSFTILNLKGGGGFHGERVHVMQRVGKLISGRLLDGIEHSDFPACD